MQILLNFLTNAIKFSDSGKIITLRLVLLDIQDVSEKIGERKDLFNAVDNEEIEKYAKFRIDIEDNGAGISEENINRLFIDFGMLEQHRKMNSQGTGLGLSICKRIAEQMGG